MRMKKQKETEGWRSAEGRRLRVGVGYYRCLVGSRWRKTVEAEHNKALKAHNYKRVSAPTLEKWLSEI